METLYDQLYATFGVFTFIILAMGFFIKYLMDELKQERKAHDQFTNKVADAIVYIKTVLERM